MRRRRSKSVKPGVSLFPFLAVLICTLGVLIVLLVLAVKSASIKQEDLENAVAASEVEAAEEAAAIVAKQQHQKEVITDLENDIDLHILEAEGFGDDRPRIRREVVKAREYRAHLNKEIDEIEEQAKQLLEEMKLLDSDFKSVETRIDDVELKRLDQQIETAQSELFKKRSEVRVVEQKKYSIVPYHGAGGTKRVPVFVECDRDGLTLQPWGIRLSRDDFYHPVAAGNPVDAALSTVRNYYQKYELTEKDQRPYPLLVVRPDGAQSYGLARRSLVSWDDEFGYELVSQDKDLEFGTVDAQLEKEIRSAVATAKQNQLALKRRRSLNGTQRNGSGQRYAGSGTGRGGSGGLRASSQHGGFVREGGGSRSGESNQQVAYDQSQSGGENARISSDVSSTSASNSNASGSSASDSSQTSGGPSANGAASPTASLANSRGANWALPTQTSGATGYVRPLSLILSNDSMAIRNTAGQRVTIPIGANPTKGVDKMVNIIWQRIDAWGIAGSNAFWKPSLAVDVQPGARQRFEMLKQMLRGSGLGVEEVSR